MIPALYFKSYRERLGFPSQAAAKDFLSAKDIRPGIDFVSNSSTAGSAKSLSR
jgi:hypothetical protein